MNGTRIPLQIWFYAMLHFANSTDGVSSRFLARHLGLADFPAFRMARRIRYQMAAIDDPTELGGPDVSVFLRLETVRPIIRRRKGRHGRARILIMNDGASVRTVVIGHSSPKYVRMALLQKAHDESIFVTDCPRTFALFEKYLARPKLQFAVDESGVTPGLSTKHKSFQLYFNHILKTQHVGVSYHRLWLYLKEAEFRYARRERSKDTFPCLVGSFPDLSTPAKAILENDNNVGIGARG